MVINGLKVKKRKGLINVFNLISLVVLFLATIFNVSKSSKIFASDITSNNVYELLNTERIENNLQPLRLNDKLTTAAYLKAYDMLSKQYWAHYGPDGESPWEYILSSGYDYRYSGENLAYGFDDVFDLHYAWMNSEMHKQNILNGSYRDVGIATIEGIFEGKDTVLVVELFGVEQSSAVPEKDGSQDRDFAITYPESDEVINEQLLAVLGKVKSVNSDYNVRVYVDDIEYNEVYVSSNTFSQRVDISEYGEHTIEAILAYGDEVIDRDDLNIEIVPMKWSVTVWDIRNSTTENGVNVTGNISTDVQSVSIKSLENSYSCEIFNGSFSCNIKTNNNSDLNLVLVDKSNNSTLLNIQNIVQTNSNSGRISSTENKLLSNIINFVVGRVLNRYYVIAVLFVLLLIEVTRLTVLNKKRMLGYSMGYRLGLILVSLLMQFIYTYGTVV